MHNNSQYHNIIMSNNPSIIGMRNPSKFHVHSSTNGMNFNDLNGINPYNQYGD
jgi:hypothetical protein